MLAVLFVRVMVIKPPAPCVMSAVAEMGPLPPGGVPVNVNVSALEAVAEPSAMRQNRPNDAVSLLRLLVIAMLLSWFVFLRGVSPLF